MTDWSKIEGALDRMIDEDGDEGEDEDETFCREAQGES